MTLRAEPSWQLLLADLSLMELFRQEVVAKKHFIDGLKT